MTQLPKGTAKRTGLIRAEEKAEKASAPQTEQHEKRKAADAALRSAREKAEIERAPSGKEAPTAAGEEQSGILDDDLPNDPEGHG